MKATLLSWCAKAGLHVDVRMLLGYHAKPKDKSVLEYSRDAVAEPLRQLLNMLSAVRRRKFVPDTTRSGRRFEGWGPELVIHPEGRAEAMGLLKEVEEDLQGEKKEGGDEGPMEDELDEPSTPRPLTPVEDIEDILSEEGSAADDISWSGESEVDRAVALEDDDLEVEREMAGVDPEDCPVLDLAFEDEEKKREWLQERGAEAVLFRRQMEILGLPAARQGIRASNAMFKHTYIGTIHYGAEGLADKLKCGRMMTAAYKEPSEGEPIFWNQFCCRCFEGDDTISRLPEYAEGVCLPKIQGYGKYVIGHLYMQLYAVRQQ